MIISAATKDDLRLLAQVIHTLQAGQYSLNGKDVCAAADAMRFLQGVAVKASQAYTEELTAIPDTPLPGMGDVNIKAFHPGRPSKK